MKAILTVTGKMKESEIKRGISGWSDQMTQERKTKCSKKKNRESHRFEKYCH